MLTARISMLPWVISVAVLGACATEQADLPTDVPTEVQGNAFANSEWSEPVNLGSVVNTGAVEFNPELSPDELSLYFGSNRPGGAGGFDIWVSRRACVDCPWETPVNLGPTINTSASENGPNLSIDGHLLFFASTRPGGQGGNDIYVSWRADPGDDFGWTAPVSLGLDVNTSADEGGPEYLQSAEDGHTNFYFNRRVAGGATDIYAGSVTRDGQTVGPAVLVSELSHLTADDQAVTVRTDGREVLFQSDRPGTLGMFDLWVSTRRSVPDQWSAPVNLGAPMNSTGNDVQPSLSRDGRTLIFASGRPGGQGQFDIWMSTRTPGGQ